MAIAKRPIFCHHVVLFRSRVNVTRPLDISAFFAGQFWGRHPTWRGPDHAVPTLRAFAEHMPSWKACEGWPSAEIAPEAGQLHAHR